MQVYQQEDDLIERWQWNDPALRNLSDVVLSLLRGQGNPDPSTLRLRPSLRRDSSGEPGSGGAGWRGGRALDLGCGSGRMAADLAAAGFDVDGIDVEQRAVAIGRRIMARRGLAVRLYAGDVYDPLQPVAAGGYDLVLCTEVLEHVGPWRELLARGGELLRPGGTLIVSVPRDPAQFSVLDSYAGHLRRFRDHELLAELQSGYEQITVRYLGFPAMRTIVWAYTRALKLTNRSHASQSQSLWREPGPTKRLAVAAFYLLLKFDNLFSRLPLGATLVVRARKRTG